MENQLSRYGALAKALPFTFGKIFFVTKSSDAITADVVNTLKRDADGVDRVYTSVSAAYDACVSGRNDIIILDSNGTHELTEMLTVSKNRVHFIGLDYLLGDRRKYGQGSKINYADGVATADPFAVKVTGVRNSFLGIKFINNNTDAQVVATVGEGGEYTVYRNCEFYDAVRLNSQTQAELVLNGDSAQFFDCTFGSLADAVVGDVVRPAVLLTKATVGTGLVSRDVLFDGCKFWKQAGGTTTAMVKGGATDVERVMEFHDCQFVASVLGSTPAVAIDVATLTVGSILLTGDTCGYDVTKLATATGVISCLNAKVATATIGLQAT